MRDSSVGSVPRRWRPSLSRREARERKLARNRMNEANEKTMKTTVAIKRRDFLSGATGLVGLATQLDGLGAVQAFGAEGRPDSGPRNDDAEKVLRDLEAKNPEFLNVPRKDGQFLKLLVKATRARNVLEVGTSRGYAA